VHGVVGVLRGGGGSACISRYKWIPGPITTDCAGRNCSKPAAVASTSVYNWVVHGNSPVSVRRPIMECSTLNQ
jgi:hypothetical protein